jgi:hypothetical protein
VAGRRPHGWVLLRLAGVRLIFSQNPRIIFPITG